VLSPTSTARKELGNSMEAVELAFESSQVKIEEQQGKIKVLNKDSTENFNKIAMLSDEAEKLVKSIEDRQLRCKTRLSENKRSLDECQSGICRLRSEQKENDRAFQSSEKERTKWRIVSLHPPEIS
jgi:septal ring factor EnvC (AmiA/AmiB activator)